MHIKTLYLFQNIIANGWIRVVGEGDHLQGPGVEQVSHQNFLDLNNPEQDQTQNLRGNEVSDFSQRFCSEISD